MTNKTRKHSDSQTNFNGMRISSSMYSQSNRNHHNLNSVKGKHGPIRMQDQDLFSFQNGVEGANTNSVEMTGVFQMQSAVTFATGEQFASVTHL